MAIVLKANSSYNLVSENSSSEGKVIAHVKLTDSCLRALEEYQSRVSNFSSNLDSWLISLSSDGK